VGQPLSPGNNDSFKRFSRAASQGPPRPPSQSQLTLRAHTPAGQHDVGRQDEIEIVKSFLWSIVAEAAPRHGGRQRKIRGEVLLHFTGN
jgi:hypothetical protein